MIALLRGTVAGIGEDWAVVDVGGVGYLVICAASTLQRLPRQGQPVELHTEMQMREDGITLYGFLEPADRVWFRMLQSVQGVGARVALSLLGVLRPQELATAVALGDKAALTRAAGVGTRLAARIAAELKDRVGGLPVATGAAAPVAAAQASGPVEDALSALVNLGYGRSDAFTALARVQGRLGEDARVDQLIREGLKELTG
jgi:Holliday junction DNA helicase RuvA